MKWEFHYTGIEIAQWRGLYLQRDNLTKRLQFIRLSWRHHMVGLFIGHLNYIPGHHGFELFTGHFHLGFITRYWFRDTKWFETKWSGSIVKPWSAVTWRLWRIGFGMQVPQWYQKRKDDKAAKEYADRWTHCEGYDEPATDPWPWEPRGS